MNAHETYQPPPSSYSEIAEIITGMQREAAKQLEFVQSVARQVHVDGLHDAGFDVCEACSGTLDKRFARFCDYCRDEDLGVKDEIEEDFALNEADRMNDQAVERELA